MPFYHARADENPVLEISADERFGPPVRTAYQPVAGLGKIDVNQGGTVCYHTPESITLWRAQAGRGERITLKNTSTSQQTVLPWPAEQASLAWPVGKLPVVDGTSYLLKTARLTEIVVLYQMPDGLQDEAEQKAWLQQQGCQVVVTAENE